jgi:hypothetical protein
MVADMRSWEDLRLSLEEHLLLTVGQRKLRGISQGWEACQEKPMYENKEKGIPQRDTVDLLHQ